MSTVDSATLSHSELEHFLFAVESSLQVRRPHQFILWEQGQLHGLIPHGVLFCVHGMLPHQFSIMKYAGQPVPEKVFPEIKEAERTLIAQLVNAWKRNGEEPLLIRAQSNVGHSELAAAIGRCHLENVLCHGTQNINGGTSSCFVFARMPEPLWPIRLRYLAELLLPHLSAAFVRTLIDHARDRAPVAIVQRQLTGREAEILEFVSQGKSNLQIGRALRISPLTVKNHVQNILKKLRVQNRAQAVTTAIGMNLFDPSRRT